MRNGREIEFFGQRVQQSGPSAGIPRRQFECPLERVDGLPEIAAIRFELPARNDQVDLVPLGRVETAHQTQCRTAPGISSQQPGRAYQQLGPAGQARGQDLVEQAAGGPQKPLGYYALKKRIQALKVDGLRRHDDQAFGVFGVADVVVASIADPLQQGSHDRIDLFRGWQQNGNRQICERNLWLDRRLNGQALEANRMPEEF